MSQRFVSFFSALVLTILVLNSDAHGKINASGNLRATGCEHRSDTGPEPPAQQRTLLGPVLRHQRYHNFALCGLHLFRDWSGFLWVGDPGEFEYSGTRFSPGNRYL